MLDSLIDAAKGQLVATLTQKTGLQPAQAEQSVPLAKESITEGLTSAVSSGNIGSILDMVKGAAGSSTGGGAAGGLLQNAVYQSIAGNFISKLTGKLGIPASMAQTVSSYALPFIMSKLAGRAQEAGDTQEIDKGSLLSVLGLDAGGLLGKAGDLLGGGKSDSDGGSGGGLGGALGGFLK
ncbi:hypothetical protein LEM8419_00576 [Neolewinella maritima]|uniref:DUF937 domain-containing protein n=1 Tax=Neolewinella maritima TaxID=1383882 RepID=A0ABN8F0G8_9BACT|nr:DUF937 domain-containing protein [Neolewinella maritima]CAH0999278.1 hypothetical protein LEM8419_00576 [Neolewinella maritima]